MNHLKIYTLFTSEPHIILELSPVFWQNCSSVLSCHRCTNVYILHNCSLLWNKNFWLVILSGNPFLVC